uniref:Centrosomal protein 295 n=1 Tax=Pipistrellus kuhlii TaxID=59472 RepID=A0A7J7WZK4_PIPKU|nr:centrosomal protein 295 [Pipistrellus kuhlii]
MKRKVVNAGKMRLSPNEEAFILKEDYERRRKLRLLQVREQERDIALQRREDIKQRRYQQFNNLAEVLRAEWEESQTQKINNLEKLYLASLRSMGEGHQQAKENEPDLNALAQRAAERKRKAELRHKEALKIQKNQKEMSIKRKTWHIKARKEALLAEKERSAKITSLPPPPPSLFENIEVKRTSNVKTNSSTYHHLYAFVNRETDTEQPDPHLAAEEEAKRLEEVQKQAEKERMEQTEKAHVRGFQAMKKIHLAQNQEKLMKELKELQQEDLARRRQTVAQMPPQLVALPYKRSEMKEDWQRELEFAFEDMYNADKKVKGNLILHLEPEPLPTVTDQIQDEELDLSMGHENLDETEKPTVTEPETISPGEADVPLAMKTQPLPSKIIFKKLLSKIRNQKSLWTIKSMSEDESEMTTTVGETESKAPTFESETTTIEEGTLSSRQEQVESDMLTIDSGPLTSEDQPISCDADPKKEQEINEIQPITAVAHSSVLLHPQEEAIRIRMAARQKQIMEIEEQKQKQLELLEQIEQQRLRLETDCFRAQLEEEKRKKTHETETEVGTSQASCTISTDEESHRQMIRNYQHQLLQQKRLHRQSVETARKQLLQYQTMLKGKHPSMPEASSISDSVVSVPPRKYERPTIISELWDQGQRPKLSPNKYEPIQTKQIPQLEQDYFQVPRQNYFPQRQVGKTETDALAKKCLGSQEQTKQFSQTETQQRDYKSVPKDSHIHSRTLSQDRPLILQHANEVAGTSDSQQMFSENNENTSSKPREPSSFLPLLAEHSFVSLPTKVEFGKIQEPLSTMSKDTVSISHPVISQMQDKSLPSSGNITAQKDHLKLLQEQLDLQKEILRSRREAQEQLLSGKQKDVEGQTGTSMFHPLVPMDSFASLPSVRAASGRIQELSPTKNNNAVSSGHPGVPQLQDRLLGFSQSILSQQKKLKFLHEQLNIQRDRMQARREAQEVLHVHKQGEQGGRVWSEQTEPPFLPSQVAQHTFPPFVSTGTQSGKIWEQRSSKNEEGLLSNQSEIPKSQDGSLSFLQQFLPLHNSLKLLQEQLTAQRDALQARHEAQMKLLSHRQRDLRDSKSGQMSSSFPPMGAQRSAVLQASVKTEPRRIENPYLSEKESTIPISHSVIPTFQDESFSSPQRSLPQQENLTALQSEFEKGISSESLTQVAESERCREFSSSDSAGSLSHSVIPRLQERFLRFSQGHLEEHQEWLGTEEALHVSQKTQGNISSEQTGSSSFVPQLGHLSFASVPSESGKTWEPFSTERDGKIPSSHFQIPELQDRLLKISQLIQPQQDNLKALQEQLAAQREAIIQSRQEAQKEHEQRERREGIPPEQADTSFFLPLREQYSFASLPLTESVMIQESCPTESGTTASSSHSEIPRLPAHLLGLPQSVLPQLVLPRQNKFEEKLSSEHFIQPHHRDLMVLQQQLDLQREAIRFRQEAQEELLSQRLSKLDKRVSCEQVGSSLALSQVALPVDSERIQKSFPTRSQDRLLSLSQPSLPQQVHLTAQLDLQKEMVHSDEKAREEPLLTRKGKLIESESSAHTIPSLLLPKEREHSFISLPSAEVKYKDICESDSSRNEHIVSSSNSVIPEFQGRLLSFSQSNFAQQHNLGLQKQLDVQREVMHYSQKELLVQRQTALQQQIQKHQETLKDFLKDSQTSKHTLENDLQHQMLKECPTHFQGQARSDHKNISSMDRSNSDDNQLLSEGEHLNKELGRRASKPPVAKVKCGLDLNQHELSMIQEVESPASGRPSILDSYQDRDPLRVSVSREQSFLRTPLDCDPFSHPHPIAQENICGDNANETVKVKETVVENQAVLTYAVDKEERTYLSAAKRPVNKAETQEIYHEPSSSITISTGSLSTENTDLSFTDPVDLDFPELEYIFPSLHRQLFKPLEPQPDFDLSSLSFGISEESRDQSSEASGESHHATLSPKRTALRRTSLPSLNTSLSQQPDPNLTRAAALSFGTENIIEGSEQSFQQLLPEFSSQEGSQHADLPSIFSIEARDSSQGMENQYSSESTEVLQNKGKNVHFQLSAGNLKSPVFTSSAEANVFHQLNIPHSTPCGSITSECSMKDQLEGQREGLGFDELSERGVDKVLRSQGFTEENKNETCGVLSVNLHVQEIDSQLCVRTVEMGTSVQIAHTIQNEKYFENSTKAENPKIIPNLSQPSQSELFSTSGSFSLQNSIPVWETESGHGIMEEPELTLVSSSDISITEMDFANLSIEEKDDAKSFQESEFLPLVPDQKTAAVSAETLSKFTAVPGSLQEAFAKRKKSFIERSCQRQKEIRNKIHVSRNTESQVVKATLNIGSPVSGLKSKVKVSLSKDRKTAQILKNQRTPRLHNQLAEVKGQNEEKAKQEAYAQNIARAKEFHKKTLEKLRAKVHADFLQNV